MAEAQSNELFSFSIMTGSEMAFLEMTPSPGRVLSICAFRGQVNPLGDVFLPVIAAEAGASEDRVR